jgi:alanyl-tRNA synthetase
MKTKEIFYEHDFKKTWETKILEIVTLKKRYAIILKETAFYPGGGGQPCDLGTINDQHLIEVYRMDDMIYHVVEEQPNVEDEAVCFIDQSRRLDLMQQHTGQHLLSAVFFSQLNGQTSSFHLGLDYVTIDISIPDIPSETIQQVEDIANKYIYDSLSIKHYLTDQALLGRLPLRKQPKVEENIRLVEIEGLDYSPCGGTHLENTGQLGILKIIKSENYKGNTRVYFKCGNRALKDYQSMAIIISQLTTQLSINQEEIIERVEKELEKSKALSKELHKWKGKAAYWEAKDIIADKDDKFIANIFQDKDFEEIDDISKEITELGDYITLLASIEDKKIILSHSGQSPLHCGRVFKEHLSQYDGRGGGNNNKAQAAFSTIEDLEKFYNFLVGKISY